MFIDSRDLRLLAAQGLSIYDIAQELGQPVIRVRRAVMAHGLTIPLGVAIKKQTPRAALVARILPLAEEGKTLKEIAAALDLNYSYIAMIVRAAGISVQRQGRPNRVPQERIAKIVAMYRQGLTLETIGQSFGITRERVRQHLKAQGITSQDGGQHVAAQSRADAIAARREARALAKWGLSSAEAKALRRSGATRAYEQQRRNAHSRAIQWNLTLAQWWSLWQTSGKWEQRGRGKGKYVMSRINDSGAYEIGNVHIQLGQANSQEAVSKWRGKHKDNRGVFLLCPGYAKPWMAKVGRKSLGYFPTEEDAVAARIAYVQQHGYSFHADGRVCLRAA